MTTLDTTDYRSFIASKQRQVLPMGFDHVVNCPLAHDWQRLVIQWAIKRGRAALFLECGLGKTICQLSWADAIYKHTGRDVVIHCPVGVRQQTKREAAKFAIETPVHVVDRQADAVPGISLVNYEKLHHFDPSHWGGVVLDESSILKGFTGSTKKTLIDSYKATPFKLACTATPAPNDFLEIGNHADFLGVMPSNEMISRWFINDTMKAGGYRLRKHGARDFWQWVASWAVCLERPGDIGFDNTGYDLPPINEVVHIVEPNEREAPAGQFFATDQITATTCHDEKRHSVEMRAAKVAELVNAKPDAAWLIWCDTNYEADALRSLIYIDAVDVRGNDSEAKKENDLLAFSSGLVKRMITKPTIAGHGMNWQHCHNVVFVGLSYSYEQFYQAVRRTWRYGQTQTVNVHIVSTPQEESIRQAILRKQVQHYDMKAGIAGAMQEFTRANLTEEKTRDRYDATQRIKLPTWLTRKERSNVVSNSVSSSGSPARGFEGGFSFEGNAIGEGA